MPQYPYLGADSSMLTPAESLGLEFGRDSGGGPGLAAASPIARDPPAFPAPLQESSLGAFGWLRQREPGQNFPTIP